MTEAAQKINGHTAQEWMQAALELEAHKQAMEARIQALETLQAAEGWHTEEMALPGEPLTKAAFIQEYVLNRAKAAASITLEGAGAVQQALEAWAAMEKAGLGND